MAQITKIQPLTNPKFITPLRLFYTQSGKEKTWEAIKAHDSVAVLLYHKEKDSFLLVKQLRIATLLRDENSQGYTHELCAGIVDKQKSLAVIAQEEVFEECGYKVEAKNLKRLTSYYTSVGFSGAKQTLFFATINENMQVGSGGGIDDEEIELFYLPRQEAKAFIFDENYKKTPGLMMALYWFFEQS